MASPQQRAKGWGYEVEKQALRAMSLIFPRLRRTGSMAYKRSAADLTQDGTYPGTRPLCLVVTKEKGRQGHLLVTLAVEDFIHLYQEERSPVASDPPVRVQVKGRGGSIWVHKLWKELCESVKAEKGTG